MSKLGLRLRLSITYERANEARRHTDLDNNNNNKRLYYHIYVFKKIYMILR